MIVINEIIEERSPAGSELATSINPWSLIRVDQPVTCQRRFLANMTAMRSNLGKMMGNPPSCNFTST